MLRCQQKRCGQCHEEARWYEKGQFLEGICPVEGGLRTAPEQPFRQQARREIPLHAQAVENGHEQRRLLPALPVHLSGCRLPRDAQHQQQDRGCLHRPEEEPEQPQQHERVEPQEVHQWVFRGIGR